MTFRQVAPAILLLLLNLTLATLLLWPQRALVLTGANDFLSFYAGGRLAFQHDLYNPGAIEDAQREHAGTSSSKLSFIRLPFYAAALWLPARLRYRAAYACWQILQLAALVALLLLIPIEGRPRWLRALCASTPLAWSFANGQDLPLMLLILAAAAALGAQGRHFASGLVLSLGLAKPHLILLLPLLYLPRGRRLGLAGFALGSSLLLGICFLVAGWSWPADYARLLWTADIHEGLGRSPNWHGASRALLGLDWPGWVLAAITATAVTLWVPRLDWLRGWGAAIVGSLLVVPHLFLQDLVLLIPACLAMLALQHPKWRGIPAFLLLTPLPYLFFLVLPFPSGMILVLLEAALLVGLLSAKGPQA